MNAPNGITSAENEVRRMIAEIKTCRSRLNMHNDAPAAGQVGSDQSIYTKKFDGLLKDFEGQITEATSRQDWYNRWGRHYLPSLQRAHELQQVRQHPVSISHIYVPYFYPASIPRIYISRIYIPYLYILNLYPVSICILDGLLLFLFTPYLVIPSFAYDFYNMFSSLTYMVSSSHDPVSLSHDPVSSSHDLVSSSHDPVSLSHDPVSLSHDPVSSSHDPVFLLAVQ